MPAAADPELALEISKTIADLYGDAVAHLLDVVARRLAQGIDHPGWAEEKLADVARLRDIALADIARLRNDSGTLIEDAIDEGHRKGLAAGAADLEAVDIDVGFSRTNTRAVRALAEETVSAVHSTHGQLLRATVDAYRTVIAEASAQSTAGVVTRRAAAQRALDRFAARGITGFVDRAGRQWSIESYAEMAVRTATGRAHVQGTIERFESAGRDLVIVSDAPQECRVCRAWEGKVLSISGSTPGYPTVAAARESGLLHANCRHQLGLYVAGVTKRFTHTADPDGDAARQQQRHLEAGVRRWKRAEAVALDDAARRRAVARRRDWQAKLRAHVDANGLKRLPARERLGAR